MWKVLTTLTILAHLLPATADIAAAKDTNDFYDDRVIVQLNGVTSILVDGEVSEQLLVDISRLEKHSVIVKETDLNVGEKEFVGAYIYECYSLYDILNLVEVKKRNREEFNPIVYIFVKVTNEKGEAAILSWGEIYYPVHRQEIIIANGVAPIVPTKAKELWPLPSNTKLIVACDLVTSRNIENPSNITILSAPKSFPTDRDVHLYSSRIDFLQDGNLIDASVDMEPGNRTLSYPAVFYGRGRGIHGITYFDGIPLKAFLSKIYPPSENIFKMGLFVISAIDGYRCSFSYSEIMNRNDQSEILLIEDENREGGRFRIFASPDLFSDRAVKSVSGIEMILID